MKAVLCIGGLDPSGRAGLLADARAVTAQGARPLCVAAALTFQSSQRLAGYEAVPPEILVRQIEILLADESVGAVKIGQLGSAANVAIVERLLQGLPIVLDTPLASSSGGDLFPRAEVSKAYRPLIAKAALVTPNAVEVFPLRGQAPAEGLPAALDAARSFGVPVLLKGGHFGGDVVEDVLVRPGAPDERFSSPRVAGKFRGTGCRLASAIAGRLALGEALPDAIGHARSWLVEELKREAL